MAEEEDLDRLLAEYPKPVADLARRTLDLLVEVIGDHAETRVQHGWKAIQVGPGSRATDMRFAVMPIGASGVNLAFSHGTSLPDPRGLLEGTGRNIRHVRIGTASELESPALRELIEAELDYEGDARR